LVPNLSLSPGVAVGDLLVWDGAAWVVTTPVARLLASGVATLDAAGEALIAEAQVAADSTFVLTPQVASTGFPRILTRVVGVSFAIQSSAGAADLGVDIYWQLWSA
jgi:hypothetical protein